MSRVSVRNTKEYRVKCLKGLARKMKEDRDRETARINAEWKAMEHRIDEASERLAKKNRWFK